MFSKLTVFFSKNNFWYKAKFFYSQLNLIEKCSQNLPTLFFVFYSIMVCNGYFKLNFWYETSFSVINWIWLKYVLWTVTDLDKWCLDHLVNSSRCVGTAVITRASWQWAWAITVHPAPHSVAFVSLLEQIGIGHCLNNKASKNSSCDWVDYTLIEGPDHGIYGVKWSIISYLCGFFFQVALTVLVNF